MFRLLKRVDVGNIYRSPSKTPEIKNPKSELERQTTLGTLEEGFW